MASYFTIPKLIGFAPMSKTQHIQRCTFTHSFSPAEEHEGQDMSAHTDGADRGMSTEIEAHHVVNEAVSRGKNPTELPKQQQIVPHMLYANH